MAKDDKLPEEIEQLKLRLELLERENERLQRRVEPMFGPDNPWFDPIAFQRILRRGIFLFSVPIYPLAIILLLLPRFGGAFLGMHIGPIPLIDIAGSSSGYAGLGLGIIACGGMSLGVISLGGLGMGIVALGGGAVGIFAIGGGSVGLVALGGGAFGYIALGGGAYGYYALGQHAHGRYVLGLNRQDPEAVALFVRFVPGLRAAVTTAMPVIPLPPKSPPPDERANQA